MLNNFLNARNSDQEKISIRQSQPGSSSQFETITIKRSSIVLSTWNLFTVDVIKWLLFLIHPDIFSYISTWSKETDNSLFFRHQNWARLVFHNMKWNFRNFSYSNHWNGKQNWDFSNLKKTKSSLSTYVSMQIFRW